VRPESRDVYQAGDLIIDVGQVRLSRAGQEIVLPKLSFELLVALVRAAPNVVSLEEMMARVWPGVVVSPETVTQRVKLLRDALQDDPKLPRYIAGVRGRGYRLVVSVASGAVGEPANVDVALPVQPEPLPETAPLRRRWYIATAGLAVVAATLVIVMLQRLVHRPEQSAAEGLPERSIAVLPFVDFSSEPAGRVLALGISEAVLHQLAADHQLNVIARSSSFAFEGRNVDAREIGRQLNVHYLLEGSLQSAQSRLRVTTQLIDTVTGAHVWSVRFDRTPTDLFALQDEIAAAVTTALEVSVEASATARPPRIPTKNLDAWIAYQQGRDLSATRRLADLERAQERFATATQLDPAFVLAYVAQAETLMARRIFPQSDSWLGVRPDLSAADQTQIGQWLARALLLDPQEGMIYTVRAWSRDSEADAESDYRHGLALSPNDATGYERFAKILYSRHTDGRLIDPTKRDEAFGMIDRARALNPLSPSAHITKALMLLYGRGDATAANGLLVTALSLRPNYYPAIMRLAEVKYWQGDYADAIRYGEQALTLEPEATWARHYLLRMYLEIGDVSAAADLAAGRDKSDPYLRVPIYLYQHRWQQASDLADQPSESGSPLDVSGIVWAWLLNARATGDYERGRSELADWAGVRWERGRATLPESNLDYGTAIALAEALRFSGRAQEAKELLLEAMRLMDHASRDLKRGEYAFQATRPAALALLGDQEGALRALDFGVAHPSDGTWWYVLELEPAFDGLRANPRFRTLVERVQARAEVQRQRLEELRAAGLAPRRGSGAQRKS
jgi:transcriptional activator of cad operon